MQEAIAAVQDPRLNTDSNPVTYYYQTRAWMEELSPRLSRVASVLSGISVWWASASLALVLLVVALTRGPTRRTAVILLATAAVGGFGMVIEVLALLAFQSTCGYLYHALAMLMAAFMAGLAAGAALMSGRRAAGPMSPRVLAAILAAAAVFCLVLPLLLRIVMSSPAAAGVAIGAVLFVTGCLVGIAFPVAVALYRRDREAPRAAGAVYAADLIGSAGAAIIVGIAAVPLLGIAGTAYATAVCVGAALATVVAFLRG
jgi:hypothetical protein